MHAHIFPFCTISAQTKSLSFSNVYYAPGLAARMTALSQPRRQKHIGPNMSETYCWLFSTNTEVPKYSDQTLLKISD